MKRYCLLGLLVMGVAGCANNEPTTQPFTLPTGIIPGTRLSPKLLLADDGTIFPHPTIWKDSEFGECEFMTSDDGKYRCLPSVPMQQQPTYLDPSCVQEVFVYKPEYHCAPMGIYALVQTSFNGCDATTTRVLNAGKKVDVATVYANDAGSSPCQAFMSIPTGIDVYLLGDEIVAGDFVSAWR